MAFLLVRVADRQEGKSFTSLVVNFARQFVGALVGDSGFFCFPPGQKNISQVIGRGCFLSLVSRAPRQSQGLVLLAFSFIHVSQIAEYVALIEQHFD